MDALLVLGVSHKTAPLALRERLALPERRSAAFLMELLADAAIHEAVAISTCNRTEVYLFAADPVGAEAAALGALAAQAEMAPTELAGSLYSRRGADAVRHLFEVAAGLDSMVIGEAEIQGQVKRAYQSALVEGATGPLTNRLFRDAISTGKRVRSETGIGRSHVSVSSIAVELARATLGELSRRRVLVVGAGENGELTAEALHRHGVESVFIANRRYDRAIGLAQRFGGVALRLDDMPDELVRSDIVVTSTNCPFPIIGREELAGVMDEREGRPLVMIDLAVPRDVEPDARSIDGVTVIDMDDLQAEASSSLGARASEAGVAREIVHAEVERFSEWIAGLEAVPTIAALRDRGEQVAEHVLRENESRWESLSEADRERLGVMAHAIVSRLLHEPTMRLRGVGDGEASYIHVQALRDLFGLEPPPPVGEEEAAEVTSLEARRRRRR